MLEQLRYGCTIMEVSRLLGVSRHFIQYHTDKKWREIHNKRTMDYRNRKKLIDGYLPMTKKEILEDKFETIIKQLERKL